MKRHGANILNTRTMMEKTLERKEIEILVSLLLHLLVVDWEYIVILEYLNLVLYKSHVTIWVVWYKRYKTVNSN